MNISLSSGCINNQVASQVPGRKVEFLALQGNYYKSRLLKSSIENNSTKKISGYCALGSNSTSSPSENIAFEDSEIIAKLKSQKILSENVTNILDCPIRVEDQLSLRKSILGED